MSHFQEVYIPSTIEKELARLDPEVAHPKTFRKLLYARSSISEPRPFDPDYSRFPLMEKFAGKKGWFENLGTSVSRFRPDKPKVKIRDLPFLLRAFSPAPAFFRSFQPPRYFFRGVDEANTKLHPAPIPYLIQESQETPMRHSSDELQKYIQENLPKKGRLSQNRKGFIYVELDERYLKDLLPFLPDKKAKAAPYLGNYSKPDCPHIPVILISEKKARRIGDIRELGEEIFFEIRGLYSVKPDAWPKVEKVWFLTVSAPELEKIRERYHLSPRVGGHDFAIAIGIVPREKAKALPTMRINPAFLAA